MCYWKYMKYVVITYIRGGLAIDYNCSRLQLQSIAASCLVDCVRFFSKLLT
jgi:hypothetical protein